MNAYTSILKIFVQRCWRYSTLLLKRVLQWFLNPTLKWRCHFGKIVVTSSTGNWQLAISRVGIGEKLLNGVSWNVDWLVANKMLTKLLNAFSAVTLSITLEKTAIYQEICLHSNNLSWLSIWNLCFQNENHFFSRCQYVTATVSTIYVRR